MRKLQEVEYAKNLMAEAFEWSLWRWLTAKKQVRQAADAANAALAAEEQRIKSFWSDELTRAYTQLQRPAKRGAVQSADPALTELARAIKEADEEAEGVRLDAEATFDEADRLLSTSLAREGTQQAIQAWTLREKAIRKAEGATRRLREK